MTETQQRFLQAIAERVAAERVLELYLFPSIRQGGMESGVAVFAAVSEPHDAEVAGDEVMAPAPEGAEPAGKAMESAGEVPEPAGEATEPTAESVEPAVAVEPVDPAEPAPITRFVVYSASYRLTLKGHERGSWDAEVTAEADAPLRTIDDVVRGVQKRTGERGDAHRLTGDAFRSAITEPVWAVHD